MSLIFVYLLLHISFKLNLKILLTFKKFFQSKSQIYTTLIHIIFLASFQNSSFSSHVRECTSRITLLKRKRKQVFLSLCEKKCNHQHVNETESVVNTQFSLDSISFILSAALFCPPNSTTESQWMENNVCVIVTPFSEIVGDYVCIMSSFVALAIIFPRLFML